MAALIVSTVIDALNDAGITAQAAYPGGTLPNITQVQAAVSLEKLEYTARSATVLVTVMVPVASGGGACENAAIQIYLSRTGLQHVFFSGCTMWYSGS